MTKQSVQASGFFDVQRLARYIPGGMFRCLWDERLTLMEVSDGFLKLLGYSRGEIRDAFGDSVRAMIDSRDWDRILADVIRQLETGNEKEIEYRMRRRDGDVIWVLDKGNLVTAPDGEQSFYCLLVDITAMRADKEELRLSLERHRIIMEQTNDIIVECDLARGDMMLGATPHSQRMEDFVRQRIHPHDREAVAGLFAEIRGGAPYREAEARVAGEGKGYLWSRLRLTTQFDEMNRPVKAVGVLLDIDRDKRQRQELARLSRKDSLTGLLNKSATFSQVRQRLEDAADGARFALMIIDVDNFKLVNDTMGHLFGDEFLVGVARRIGGLFRGNDLLGRIGGDEFLVFMDGLSDAEAARRRAEQVLESFGRVTTEAGLAEVSCSIGIALYPSGGKTFQELFHHADQAMYLAKQCGKKQYRVYDDAMDTVLGVAAPAPERPAALPEGGSVLLQIGERALDLLLQEDVPRAVGSMLEMAGRRFDVSRVYVFESAPDGSFTRNTFEWCGDGVEPQMENLQYLTFEEDLRDVYELFNEEGVLYCRDVRELPGQTRELLEAQGIRAMLQVALIENKTIRLVVGFDECRRTRYWSGEQIECLRLLSKILRLSDRLAATAGG